MIVLSLSLEIVKGNPRLLYAYLKRCFCTRGASHALRKMIRRNLHSIIEGAVFDEQDYVPDGYYATISR